MSFLGSNLELNFDSNLICNLNFGWNFNLENFSWNSDDRYVAITCLVPKVIKNNVECCPCLNVFKV